MVAVGNHINSYYRTGEAAKCGRWFDGFKWCLWYGLSDNEKKLVRKIIMQYLMMIQAVLKERRMERAALQQSQIQSEPVWQLRSTPPPDFPPVLPKI